MDKRHSEPISFRLRGGILQKLEERAAAEGVSKHEIARTCLIAYLEDERGGEWARTLAELRSEIAELRRELRSGGDSVPDRRSTRSVSGAQGGAPRPLSLIF